MSTAIDGSIKSGNTLESKPTSTGTDLRFTLESLELELSHSYPPTRDIPFGLLSIQMIQMLRPHQLNQNRDDSATAVVHQGL